MTAVAAPRSAQARALAYVEAVAARLDTPAAAACWTRPQHRAASGPQSLGRGAAGVALLHIERSRAGIADWAQAHDWLTHVTRAGVHTGQAAGAYRGAPAILHVLQVAASVRPGNYRHAIAALRRQVATGLRHQTGQIHRRLDRSQFLRLADWDLISGLTGVTRILLDGDPAHPAIPDALDCLTRLILEPVRHHGEPLPGWWTPHNPRGRVSPEFTGGHANLGLAHGIIGPLALLAIAATRGVTVAEHTTALTRVCDWLDRHQQRDADGPWWPQWTRRHEHRHAALALQPRTRPSWCYGAAGQARAQQLAGEALADPARLRMARNALRAAARHAGTLAEPNICHGRAGLIHTLRHAGEHPDAIDALLEGLPPKPDAAAEHLLADGGPELLEGAVGVALTLLSAVTDPALEARWDTCLLLR